MTTNTARQLRLAEDDILRGLYAQPKTLPCRLLYDVAGAELYARITRVPDYYLTRVELALLAEHVPRIAATVGPDARVVEPGCGEGVKTRRLLAALTDPALYVPIDLARDQLAHAATALRAARPGLAVTPVVADYMQALVLPEIDRSWRRTLVFFPGSTIGNLEPEEAITFLAKLARLAGPRGLLLLGGDGTTDEARLARAYDDEGGVTAQFNRNVLAHVNRLRDATFEPDAFAHRAVWNRELSRIEMQLVSTKDQIVRVAGAGIGFQCGETITTEHCYKHSQAAMTQLLATGGWRVREVFAADEVPYRLWLCERVA